MTTATQVETARAHWIENDFDGALQAARANGTPVLAWWTAHWCPPCNELKSAVFNDPAFAKRSAKLKLVRLDGDVRGAQALGDRLHVTSYPSPLLLDERGEERLRLPGGFKADEFCALLDRAVAYKVGIAELGRLARSAEPLAEKDYDLLAHHWWGIDPRLAAGAQRLPLLLGFYHSCPERLAPLRLRLLAHAMWAASRHPDAQPGKHAGDWRDAPQFLLDHLAQPLPYSQLYPMLVAPDITHNVASNDGDAHARLDAALLDAAERLIARGGLTHTEHLIALMAVLVLLQRRDGKESAHRAMAPRVIEAVRNADRESIAFEDRQSAMNMAGHLLKAAGLVDEARALFQAQTETSPEGTYFMSYLADIAFERGDRDGGLEWLRRAWQENRPGASRFARGVRYVAKAAQVREDRGDFVSREAVRLLAEQADAPDAFQGLNRKNLRILLESLPALAQRLPREAR